MTMIVAMSGRKQSGKNVTCSFLRNVYGHDYSVGVYAFADKLKEFCRDYLGIDEKLLWGTDEDKNTKVAHIRWENWPITNDNYGPMTIREILQQFGTNIMRRMYEDVWVHALLRQVEKDKPELALISDMRFPSETQAVWAKKGYCVRLTRKISDDAHESETALDNTKLDFTIDNANLSLDETLSQAVTLVGNLLKK